MANEPDDIFLTLLRDIRMLQDKHGNLLVGQSDLLARQDERLVELGGQVMKLRDEVVELGGHRVEPGQPFAKLEVDVKAIRLELDILHTDSHEMRAEIHQMRGEIRGLQTEIANIRKAAIEHTVRFDLLDEKFELLREGTMMAIGFAVDAGESNKKLKEALAGLANRVEELERRSDLPRS